MESEITIKIKTINSTTFPINICLSDSIFNLKEKIFQKVRIQKNNQRLIFQGRVLENDKSLKSYRIEENDVIHLVQTDSRSYVDPIQRNNINTNNNINNRIPDFHSMINSIFPNVSNLLRDFRENRNNLVDRNMNNINTNINQINPLLSGDISASFSHLLSSPKYDLIQGEENLCQAFASVSSLIDNLIDIPREKAAYSNKLYSENGGGHKFNVGEWVDVKRVDGSWGEGQVRGVNEKDKKLNIHFMGIAGDVNEWISYDSDRITTFRRYTAQRKFDKFSSPHPNNDNNNMNINDESQRPIYYTLAKKFDPINNDLIIFLSLLQKKVSTLINLSSNNQNETYNFLLKLQLYPLMDRIGRLLTDLAEFVMNSCLNYFEDNLYKLRKNLSDPSLRFMNVNEDYRVVRRNKVNLFQKLAGYSVLKPLEPQRNNIPLFGLVVTQRRNYIEESRRYIVSRETLSILKENKDEKKEKILNPSKEITFTLNIPSIKNTKIVRGYSKKKEKIEINVKTKEEIKNLKESSTINNNNIIDISKSAIYRPKIVERNIDKRFSKGKKYKLKIHK